MSSKNATIPAGLSVSARRRFKQITTDYDLRTDEIIMLEAAMRQSDTADRLEAALIGAPLVTAGAGGQDRVNPLIVEARQQRLAMGQLFRQLGLPDEAAGVKVNQQRQAGNASWAARSTGGIGA